MTAIITHPPLTFSSIHQQDSYQNTFCQKKTTDTNAVLLQSGLTTTQVVYCHSMSYGLTAI